MLDLLSPLRGMDLLGISIRIVLSVLCGGLIGIEREYKRRPAGFRTHILISLGAAMTTATGQYLCTTMGYPTDVARLGAQVIAGVGFIGAGTIIMTKHRRVRGLTTAAGLWVSAIVGLCCGAGFYEGALYATVLVLLAEMFFSKIEYQLMRRVREITIYVEYLQPSCLDAIMERCSRRGIKVTDVEITSRSGEGFNRTCAVLSLLSRKGAPQDTALSEIETIEGVLIVQRV